LAIIITITAGYVAGLVTVVRMLGGRLDRLEDRVTAVESVLTDVRVLLGRLDERLAHMEHHQA
jgi:hypothetical protein